MALTNPSGRVQRLIAVLTSLLVTLIVIFYYVLPFLPSLIPTLEAIVYDVGVHGLYPTRGYFSFPHESPQASVRKWHHSCEDGLVLLTPNGDGVSHAGPMILDQNGGLVWMSDRFGSTANLKVQHYKNEDYLTFWSGEKAATSGRGSYLMLNSTYQIAHEVSAAGNDLHGDLHEFRILESGTALLTVYNTTTADLSAMGLGRGRDGWIIDNIFQEIDIATGELIFQWRASDHFQPVKTHMTNPLGGYQESNPFDFYHINSVEKDSKGNYLISSRHFHHVVCISPAGETMWILGGDDNEFEDRSNGHATNFKWQHDARWVSEEDGIISLFDNQKAGPLHVDAWQSRGMMIQVNLEKRTATLLHDFYSQNGILASSQGSVQVLPRSKNVFVGWGSAAAYSEFSPDGTLLCETHLAASWFFWWERMKSYRSIKVLDWHGTPMDPPATMIEDGHLYVSWNGATEVAYWGLEAALNNKAGQSDGQLSDDDFASIDTTTKSGFEDVFELPSDKGFARYRVAAMDKELVVLAYSDDVVPEDGGEEFFTILLIAKFALVIGLAAGTRLSIKSLRKCRYTMCILDGWA